MRETLERSPPVIAWLLDSDPSIRWRVKRDLVGAPDEEVQAERSRVATEGFGARLLALQGTDGSWGGRAWNRGWDSTMHVLMLLRDFGLDSRCPEARRAIDRVNAGVTWRGCGPPEADANSFFEGELEPCINGQVCAVGSYFGQDMSKLIERLLHEQLPDGGWNCDAPNGSKRASFHTTICVLEALLEYERSHAGRPDLVNARLRAQEYLLERRLFRRLSTGEIIQDRKAPDVGWLRFSFPTWWHYDVLRALDYLREAEAVPDDRIAEAIDLVASRSDADGRWLLEIQHPGNMPVKIDDGEGHPSKWNTLRALRVLAWYSKRGAELRR